MAEQKKLFIKTYGCQMNVYDSQRMRDVLTPLGYEPSDTPDGADLVVLNTDPYTVDPARLQETMAVTGTWFAGRPVDLEAFMESVRAVSHRFDPALLGGSQPHQC